MKPLISRQQLLEAGIASVNRFLCRTKHAGVKIFIFLGKNRSTVLMILMCFLIPAVLHSVLINTGIASNKMTGTEHEEVIRAEEKLRKEINLLDRKLAAKTPKSCYLVINTASNEFSLYKGFQLIRKDKCSTGSYIQLKAGDEQQWIFRTPKGEFRIRGKTISPVWKKPDWSFIEEGLPVPPPNHHTRFEYGVLGDYALDLGHGYLIHGTLYQRFLGLPVTHGCIRLNDENLELVYSSMSVGSRVYIF